MRNETWYRGEEAVVAGLADEVVSMPKRGDGAPEPEPEMRRAFDFAAYGYQGPRREEPAADAGLTEDIRTLVGEEVAAQLRAAVGEPGPVEEEPEAPEPPPAEPEPAPAAEHPEPEPVDDWAAAVAHLTQPDPWAAAVARLTRTTSASSAATEAA